MFYFFSCDWGTTSFRLRLIDSSSLNILAEVSNAEGCAKTNQGWLKQNRPERERYDYYCSIIAAYIGEIKQQLQMETDHLPLIISGMASSTVGMINLPYKEAPFFIDGSDLLIRTINDTSYFPHQTIIVSGVRTGNDVMRGEETKIIGCVDDGDQTDAIIVLPGTHPKHVYVVKNQVMGFKTYMTGEFFELLSQKSLLALSVNKTSGFDQPGFASGVKEGADGGNILHSSFLVRTNLLFEKYTPEQNFNYLSGLLIGAELKDLINLSKPVLLAGGHLGDLYQEAFKVLGISLNKVVNADKALIKGQLKIFKKAADNTLKR